jgi:hypothetical protein
LARLFAACSAISPAPTRSTVLVVYLTRSGTPHTVAGATGTSTGTSTAPASGPVLTRTVQP